MVCIFTGGQAIKGQEVSGHAHLRPCFMLIHIKAICLPVVSASFVTSQHNQQQFNNVRSRKKNIY